MVAVVVTLAGAPLPLGPSSASQPKQFFNSDGDERPLTLLTVESGRYTLLRATITAYWTDAATAVVAMTGPGKWRNPLLATPLPACQRHFASAETDL
jgi:hypothetical protein